MSTRESSADRLIQEFIHHVYELGYERIDSCVHNLSEEQLLYKPNEISNSVANLTVHLCGNLRQWIMTTFGGEKDVRKRSEEFALDSIDGKESLLGLVKEINRITMPVVSELSMEQINGKYSVQNYHVDGIYILSHVMEHYSYHVGQITYITKMLTGRPTNYYDENLL